METLDDARNFWQNANQKITIAPFIKEEVERVVRLRVKDEKKYIAQYFWLSMAYQILIYSFASHLIIKYWGDARLTLLSTGGVLLYLPLTIILMKKFKAMFGPLAPLSLDMYAHVKNQYRLLGEFFNFKKKFDLVSIPLTSVILTGILFKLYVPGSIETHPVESLAACLATLLIYGGTALLENRKHFVQPLNRLRSILTDLETPT